VRSACAARERGREFSQFRAVAEDENQWIVDSG